MLFHIQKKTRKQKATRVCLKVYRKTKHMKLKYLDQLRKKTSIVSLWSQSHSPMDNRSLFTRHKECKSQATSYKYRVCSHSLLQSRRQYSFFSRSAKPAGGFQQLCFSWVSEWRPKEWFSSSCSYFCNNIHEKITQFWLAEKGVQFFCNTSANYKWYLTSWKHKRNYWEPIRLELF